MLITLTGFMGAGKSTVGEALAGSLGCPFMDLDALVSEEAGKDIVSIFKEDGEEAFRTLELKVLKKVLSRYAASDAVVSLGGGTVTIPGVPRLLKEKSLCIWLQAAPETIRERLGSSISSRPLLKGNWEEMLLSRSKAYEEASHASLETDGHSPEEVADEIIITVL